MIRIIGGKWRSRKINFTPIQGLRPTTDSTRETLFNWLAPIINNANCLDLFAGSGALGFEALSRGARHVVMTDAAPKAINNLKENAKILKATPEEVEIYRARIPQELNKIPQQEFDIIFLDPPFHHDFISKTCEKLSSSNYLSKKTVIYLEAEKELVIQDIIPTSWQIIRHKIAGQASYYLISL